jgi:hypothetical protein
MGNKERSQKKINVFFGSVWLIPKISNAHLIFQNLGQKKKSKEFIKNSMKNMLKNQFFSLFFIEKKVFFII